MSDGSSDMPPGTIPVGFQSTPPAASPSAQPPRGDQPERPMVTPQDRREFLNDFLADQDAPRANGQEAAEAAADTTLENQVVEALRQIFDPEIPVNIYDLGLIYAIDVDGDANVAVTMTLTTPHCPVAESMPGEVEMKVRDVAGVNDAEVNLVWDPPWDVEKMSDEARLELGLL